MRGRFRCVSPICAHEEVRPTRTRLGLFHGRIHLQPCRPNAPQTTLPMWAPANTPAPTTLLPTLSLAAKESQRARRGRARHAIVARYVYLSISLATPEDEAHNAPALTPRSSDPQDSMRCSTWRLLAMSAEQLRVPDDRSDHRSGYLSWSHRAYRERECLLEDVCGGTTAAARGQWTRP